MNRLKRWHMYFTIHELNEKGLKVAQIARKLNISRNTVYKYLNMNPDDFHEFLDEAETRSKKLDPYESRILNWLKEYPDLSSAQVWDWLREQYPDLSVGASTVRSYVRMLRERYGIPKIQPHRDYEAVPDPPMGQQMQVDFGETKMRNVRGVLVKTWFIAFVLAHSRHKFVYWQDRPFVTRDVVEAHEKAFAFFGGMTHEIVYDQDHLLLTSENYGDLILTHEFALYVQKCGFQVRACRRKDPESKGRVENVVKFVKRNFARHRIFTTVDQLNEDCLAWLERTGNALMHHTTKKIPAEVFAIERQTLRPVHQINIHPRMSITRTVRKDNTIWFEGNRYSVPLGTYNGKDKVVGIELSESHLRIYDPETGEWLADHERSHLKGQLIQNTHHRRDRTKGIHAYLESVAGKFSDEPLAMNFLEEIWKRKSRYIRDQLQLIERVLDEFGPSAAEQALHYCMKYRLYGATDFADAVRHFDLRVEKQLPPVELVKPLDASNPDVWKAKPQIRQFEIYADILRGG